MHKPLIRCLGIALAGLIGLSFAPPAGAGLSVTTELKRPFSVYNSTGITTYTAATDRFSIAATVLATRFDGIDVLLPIGSATITINIRVNGSGNLSGGVSGQHDLLITGIIDLDDDSNPEYSGTLLTGEVYAFGFQEAGATDLFDAKFNITGGAMAGLYGNKVAVTITAENSSFNGNFCDDFAGGAKGNVGNLDGDNMCPRSPGYWKNHECNWPLSTLTVGGIAYNRTQLLNLLDNKLPNGSRANGNQSARLAKFTIAAKFNLLNGADDPSNIVELLSLADAFLAAHPPGATLSAADADYAENLGDALDHFVNSSPCYCRD